MIYSKTESGQAALLNRSLGLTLRQRSAFIMFDGKRSMREVLNATQGLGITESDVSSMVAQGLLVGAPSNASPVAMPVITEAPSALQEPVLAMPSTGAQAHYSSAYPIAIRLTAGLGLRGFLLNLAVEGATDLAKLQALAPKIKQAVGPEKFSELEAALYD